VASWDATPQAKRRKSAAPDNACEGWCSVVARKSPDSPANRPFAAKAARVAAAAGTGSLTLCREPAGFFPVAGVPGAPVSGAAHKAISAIVPSPMNTR
jgi:hypothetical protein